MTAYNYQRMFHHYLNFCRYTCFQSTPLNQEVLCLYVSFLAARISYKSIKAYLAAISHHCILLNVPVNIASMLKLHKLVRGIRRHQGNSFTRPIRQPITIDHLMKIYSFLGNSMLPNHDKALFWATSTLAFFGLLRVSEYTCPLVSSFNCTVHLMVSDLQFYPDSFAINIKSSKTDPFRVGCRLFIGSTNNILCPRLAMLSFINYRGLHYGPLFTYKDGSFLTRSRFAAFLKGIFTTEVINTHSFRIGGATALSLAGYTDAQIQIIGRWKSSSFTRYLRLNKDVFKKISQILSSSDHVLNAWNPDRDL